MSATDAEPRRLVYTPLDDVPPDPSNIKQHELGMIANSIAEFGMADPVVVDERTGRIASGHGRIEALKQLRAMPETRRKKMMGGRDVPEGIKVADDGTWLAPTYRGWASKDDAHAKAFLVAANRLTTIGGWDEVGLAALLEELHEDGLLELTGFDTDDLDDMLAALEEPIVPIGDDEAHEDALENFTGRAVRSLVLDYQLPRYQWLVAALDAVREGDESNSALFARLVAEQAGVEPYEES